MNDFIAFLNEVTVSEGRTFIRNQLLQRDVNGFPPGRAPLNITVPILISKMRREQELTNPNSLIWDMFKHTWKCWVGSHQVLNHILLNFDNTADFDDNEQCIAPANSELDIKCFHELLEASLNNQINQKTIQRFYEFGHFNEDEQIEELIDRALPQEVIERTQQIEQIPEQVDRFHQEIEELRTQFPDFEQTLDQRIEEVQELIESQLSQVITSENVYRMTQSIESLKTRINNINKSLTDRIGEIDMSLQTRMDVLENFPAETNSSINAFVEHIEEIISQLEQQIQDIRQSVDLRFSSVDSVIGDIQSEAETQGQPSDTFVNTSEPLESGKLITVSPRIAYKAAEIGERYAANLGAENEHYQNEEDYLSILQFTLRSFGITDSDEIAVAIHVALKAFPVIEISDKRIIKVWQLMCDDHLHYTNINVEMGWLGLQDWFPDFFSDEIFDERLERIDLDISISEMLKIGKMPWVIHFSDCDRSFPETYLPSFINWINKFANDSIRILLTRYLGTNCCEINGDVYAWTARLPEPKEVEPIQAKKLRPSGIIVTQSDWKSWCEPPQDVDQYLQNQFDMLDQLRSTIEQNDVRVPLRSFREIQQYIRLSYELLAPTLALDWALTLRLLPWIEHRHDLINQILSIPDFQDSEFSHFRNGLQQV